MSHPERGRSAGEAQLLPTKEDLNELKSDVTFESACLELIDNSLDAWKRTSDRNAPATVEIYAENHGEIGRASCRERVFPVV